MFDTMTATKAVGACCGALLAFLLLNWASDGLYSMAAGGHGAEGEEHAQAYTIDTGAEEAGAEEPAAEEGPDFATLLAAADVAAGEKVFGKCKACHKIDGTEGTGPHLNGVVDRAKASIAGFDYSEGLLAMAGDTWTTDNLNTFLTDPKAYVAGTKMSFAGLPKGTDRANLIAYLVTLQ